MSDRWQRFGSSVVEPLLLSPPDNIREALQLLSERYWHHPITNEKVTFHYKTIRHWYKRAQAQKKYLS